MLRNKVGSAGRGLGMCSVGTEYASRKHLRNAHYVRNVNNYMHVRAKHSDSTVPNTLPGSLGEHPGSPVSYFWIQLHWFLSVPTFKKKNHRNTLGFQEPRPWDSWWKRVYEVDSAHRCVGATASSVSSDLSWSLCKHKGDISRGFKCFWARERLAKL